MDISSVQFNHMEMTGFIAEARVDELNEVNYEEHSKTWVPITHELRNSKLYHPLLTPPPVEHTIYEQISEAFGVPLEFRCLDHLEEKLTLMPPEMIAQTSGHSQSRRTERRRSMDRLRNSQSRNSRADMSSNRRQSGQSKSVRESVNFRGSVNFDKGSGVRSKNLAEESRRNSVEKPSHNRASRANLGKKGVDSRDLRLSSRLRLRDVPKGQMRMFIIQERLDRLAAQEAERKAAEEDADKDTNGGKTPKGAKSPVSPKAAAAKPVEN